MFCEKNTEKVLLTSRCWALVFIYVKHNDYVQNSQ